MLKAKVIKLGKGVWLALSKTTHPLHKLDQSKVCSELQQLGGSRMPPWFNIRSMPVYTQV